MVSVGSQERAPNFGDLFIDLARTRADGKAQGSFPEKSGEEHTWNFRKFHDIIHTSVIIMFFGWLENKSCQSGELAHKILLKAWAGNLNNDNVFIQFL